MGLDSVTDYCRNKPTRRDRHRLHLSFALRWRLHNVRFGPIRTRQPRKVLQLIGVVFLSPRPGSDYLRFRSALPRSHFLSTYIYVARRPVCYSHDECSIPYHWSNYPHLLPYSTTAILLYCFSIVARNSTRSDTMLRFHAVFHG